MTMIMMMVVMVMIFVMGARNMFIPLHKFPSVNKLYIFSFFYDHVKNKIWRFYGEIQKIR
ncbi:hypothetical protein BO219_06870 [Anoxybacillus kestanbolensis]|uniref:Uncharacterized protein n=1 Tax=Anoxybacillus kestanbolensis TaxID=227476 RepID=A0A1V3FQN8_9BACL|nr:hypothetical protein BO219_06870 [Anoxybacillus kestanbolensis]